MNAATQTSEDQELIIDVLGSGHKKTGLIQLNRPKALNALSYGMIKDMAKALADWEHDESIQSVVMRGTGDKAFCAGGDVKQVYFAGKAGELGAPGMLSFDFFADEYVLNAKIAAYPKPLIALWNGIVMGGGVGVSVMGSHRVGTESLKFGMPETAIGFFPDVGGSYFMSRLGPVGTLLSLTGQAIGAGDSFKLGLATHFVSLENLPAFQADLIENGIEAALAKFEQEAPNPEKADALVSLAEKHFQFASMEEIVQSLETDTTDLAGKTLTVLKQRSPAAMKVTLRQLQEGASMSFNACLNMEFRICQRALKEHDFYEGIRAVLVDKDKTPAWSPSTLEDVSDEFVKKHFEPLGNLELGLFE